MIWSNLTQDIPRKPPKTKQRFNKYILQLRLRDLKCMWYRGLEIKAIEGPRSQDGGEKDILRVFLQNTMQSLWQA